MKNILKNCDRCNEETIHKFKKRFAHRGRGSAHYMKREQTRCVECGKIQGKSRSSSFTKFLGGRN